MTMTIHTGKTMRNLRQRGFSLVEIMVAITLSLIILGGVLAVMYSSKVTYMENDRVARIQESGRAALDLMLRDLRGAGFPGCAQQIDGLLAINNMLADSAEVPWNLAEPIMGFDGGEGAWAPDLGTAAALFPDATEGNDIFVVRTIPAGSPSFRVPDATAAGDDIVVEKDTGETLLPGTPAIISDCNNTSIFVVDTFTPDGDDLGATITRATSGGPPSNTTTSLGADFQRFSQVQPITSIAYYVAPNGAGTGTSLWRVLANNAPEELIPGVEAMQVRYGIDTDADRLITVNEYVDADEVDDWNQVVSVSLALLVRSAEENSQTQDTRTYKLLETELEPFDDNFQRSLFTTTVTLRNRTT
jgi:type IV pilus assembly protein PilW